MMVYDSNTQGDSDKRGKLTLDWLQSYMKACEVLKVEPGSPYSYVMVMVWYTFGDVRGICLDMLRSHHVDVNTRAH